MVVRISTWRITWRFLLVYLILLIITLIGANGIFLGVDSETKAIFFKPWDTPQTIFVVVAAILFIALYIPAITMFYYIIEDKYFIMKRLGKDYQFEYKNIEFIDIEESKRKKMVIFYSKTAKMRYNMGDKDGVLLETLIKKCPNIMTVDEFRRRHPEEKY